MFAVYSFCSVCSAHVLESDARRPLTSSMWQTKTFCITASVNVLPKSYYFCMLVIFQ